ncbi:hypothetical protein BDQ17DRAFT_419431 [Cyathus striatus]|nr:hypothetical protein BDQ17DRAFT_419431 [Cyathus striatus]
MAKQKRNYRTNCLIKGKLFNRQGIFYSFKCLLRNCQHLTSLPSAPDRPRNQSRRTDSTDPPQLPLTIQPYITSEIKKHCKYPSTKDIHQKRGARCLRGELIYRVWRRLFTCLPVLHLDFAGGTPCWAVFYFDQVRGEVDQRPRGVALHSGAGKGYLIF